MKRATTRQLLRDRAAAALDATLPYAERGPNTFETRKRVAAALDLGRVPAMRDILWLESVAAQMAAAPDDGDAVALRFVLSGNPFVVTRPTTSVSWGREVAAELSTIERARGEATGAGARIFERTENGWRTVR